MEDILEDRRRSSDWWWVAREFSTPVYRHRKTRSPGAIKGDVIGSVSVRFAIDQVVSESGRSQKDVKQEAAEILNQMGHQLSMTTIRIFGVLLSKSWKRIYRSVFINTDGVEAVKKLIPDYPIVVLPTHRSYMDFLIISFAFFYYNLPIPIIASGQDFMSMKIMGSMMRQAGAFFIRRSFGKDKLYWALFSEYVKTHVVNGEAPLEFFIEGTRSRSAKSLPPKFGLLTAALEPFFKAEVPDIMIVPVSISYDRTLEEVLYAYELLGVPKPKESTMGLLKARKILDDDYGNFFMTIGNPFSLREFCGSTIDRTIHNLCPKHLSPVSMAEQQAVEKLAVEVIKCQQKNLVLSPFVLIAAVLVNHLQSNVMELPLHQLVKDARWLLSLLQNFGAPINWPGDSDSDEVVRDSCKVHHNVVQITDMDTVYIEQVHSISSAPDQMLSNLSEETLSKAVSHMLLSHYSNQLLHWIVPEGLIALALKSASDIVVDKDWLYSEYLFLEKVFQFDFVFAKGETRRDFDKALTFMHLTDTCIVEGNAVSPIQDSKLFNFLLQMFEPFVGAYNVVCQTLLCPGKVVLPAAPKAIAKRAQEDAEKLLQAENFSQNTILSLESLTNAVYALGAIGALRKESRIGGVLFHAVHAELVTAGKRLEPYAGWLSTIQSEHVSEILISARAKL